MTCNYLVEIIVYSDLEVDSIETIDLLADFVWRNENDLKLILKTTTTKNRKKRKDFPWLMNECLWRVGGAESTAPIIFSAQCLLVKINYFVATLSNQKNSSICDWIKMINPIK